jgi:transaldolase/glucose-6-phosphate isomerase
MKSQATQVMNPLKELVSFGQSVWLDYIRRSLITSGELQKILDDDGLRGITSNPSIFEKAIAGSTDYKDEIKAAQKDKKLDANQIYERLAIKDIQDAADILRPVYVETKKRDGYVSLEVSPLLASDTKKTIEEAERLWKAVGKENLMVKVPGTKEGLPAIRHLIGKGININVTLLFAQEVYEQVAEAYISGLEDLLAAGGDVSKIGSVASFFVSRIDSAIDGMIENRLKTSTKDEEKAKLNSIMGKVAIANAKQAYQKYLHIFTSDRWKKLEAKGAKTQRLLWASTSTKNPNYKDTIYVDELIGKDTVNTIPPATFDAFRDHGKPHETLTENVAEADKVMKTAAELGISMKEVTDKLVEQGVVLFADAFRQLLDTLEKQRQGAGQAEIDKMTYKLPADLEKSVQASLKQWQAEDKVKKLWSHDASLWTGEDESKWLDWLNVTNDQIAHIGNLQALAKDIKTAGFTHVLLLGMGGSSLCPEVLAKTFGKINGFPQLHVLDSTDPAQVKAREKEIDLKNTLFIVSSKSGSTLEPNIFKQYFYDRVSQQKGSRKVGDQFIAITDPNSHMQKVAEEGKFRNIFYGLPGIGGRYSALSNFGMVPAAVMGMDIVKFLNQTEEMVQACSNCVPAEENPGVVLGTIMGVLAKAGRDKVTLVTSPAIYDLGAWLEQLLAESTGKIGKGLIPVDREKLSKPDTYGKDRLFVYLRLETDADSAQDKAIAELEAAGQPVVRISIADIYDLGQEFFRWEIATATAGSIIGINAFNQPDVEASKIVTRKLTDEFEKTGSLPVETPIFDDSKENIKLFTDKKNSDALDKAVNAKDLQSYLKAHFDRIKAGDYFALLAYIGMNDKHEKALQEIRQLILDKKKIATCLGFGPRFLHSTGQAYKGGPNTGVFLQVTCDDAEDLAVPEQKYSFGIVKAAQARGDFQVLVDRSRRALRVHLGKDVAKGLATLKAAIEKALS